MSSKQPSGLCQQRILQVVYPWQVPAFSIWLMSSIWSSWPLPRFLETLPSWKPGVILHFAVVRHSWSWGTPVVWSALTYVDFPWQYHPDLPTYIYFIFWPCYKTWRILVSGAGLELTPPLVETQSLNDWTDRSPCHLVSLGPDLSVKLSDLEPSSKFYLNVSYQLKLYTFKTCKSLI